MKAILQRCRDASVSVDGKVVGKCEHGLLILLGVANGDTEAEAETLAAKASKLRIFEDDNGKMNPVGRRCRRERTACVAVHAARQLSKGQQT